MKYVVVATILVSLLGIGSVAAQVDTPVPTDVIVVTATPVPTVAPTVVPADVSLSVLVNEERDALGWQLFAGVVVVGLLALMFLRGGR